MRIFQRCLWAVLPVVIGSGLLFSLQSAQAVAATYLVNSTTDVADQPAKDACTNVTPGCTLRAAVLNANANPGVDTISIDPGVYQLTITNTSGDEDGGLTGDLDLSEGVTIEAANSANRPTIQTGTVAYEGIDRIFETTCGVACTVTIDGLVIKNGRPGLETGGGIFNNSLGTVFVINTHMEGNGSNSGGGAIATGGGDVSITDSSFANNSASSGGSIYNQPGSELNISNSQINSSVDTGRGGAIFNQAATATIINSTLNSNRTHIQGGAIANESGTVTVVGSTISGNLADGVGFTAAGGAIHNKGTLTIDSTTLSNNQAQGANATGGAIRTQPITTTGVPTSVEITNSTFSGNKSTEDGEAIHSSAALEITNSTFSGNFTVGSEATSIYHASSVTTPPSATIQSSTIWGGDSIGGSNIGNAKLRVVNSIVATCADSQNLVSLGHNLSLDDSCDAFLTAAGDKPGTQVLLDTLGNNGGPTQTFALLTGSAAIGAGDNGDCPPTDQRGTARPQHTNCDIGAFETTENQLPSAADDTLNIDEDEVTELSSLLDNDDDLDGDPLVVTDPQGATHGSFSCDSAGCTYTPDADYFGGESFTYKTSDGKDTATATVTVDIASVNDKPLAVDDAGTAFAGIAVVIDVGANDSDVEDESSELIFTRRSGPAAGNQVDCQSSGICTYKSAIGYSGSDSFEYRVEDSEGARAIGEVTITVKARPKCRGEVATIFNRSGTINGTAGRDVIVGSRNADVINGKGGDDFICGSGANDTIKGGGGNDLIDGGSGDDNIDGGAGNDTVIGYKGADTLKGGYGADAVNGNGGPDKLFGNSGVDTLEGGNANDTLSGGGGAGDRCNGGPGRDTADSTCEERNSADLP